MIWKNKTHEFDNLVKILLREREKYLRVYIFGAGILGEELAITLQAYECFAGYIDNCVEKQQKGLGQHRVYSLEEYMKMHDGIIVIAASQKNIPIIEKQLKEFQLKIDKDYYLIEDFCKRVFPIISTYLFDKAFITIAQITLTERCSLKCHKCAHGCFAVDNSAKDLTLEQVYKSADSFFAKVDFIKEFVLIGGEPLLYKELGQAIQYIGERYRNQIGVYSITTNGTIVPNEDVLNACKKYNVLFRISNYARQIPWIRKNQEKLISALRKYGLAYILGKEEIEWVDYGFGDVNRNATEEELINVFDVCGSPCREIRENKFYYCVMARSVSDNLGYHVGQNDYLDLDKLEGENYRKELLEFTLGYSEKGYLDMCNHCRGAEAKNYPILAAEQIEK